MYLPFKDKVSVRHRKMRVQWPFTCGSVGLIRPDHTTFFLRAIRTNRHRVLLSTPNVTRNCKPNRSAFLSTTGSCWSRIHVMFARVVFSQFWHQVSHHRIIVNERNRCLRRSDIWCKPVFVDTKSGAARRVANRDYYQCGLWRLTCRNKRIKSLRTFAGLLVACLPKCRPS